MRVHTKVVLEWKDGAYRRIEEECESFEYEGPVSECKGGGGGGQTTTVEKSDPWEGIQPRLLELYQGASNAYRNNPQFYEGSTVAPTSSESEQARQMQSGLALQSNSISNNASDLATRTLSGEFLNPNNVQMDAIRNSVMRSVNSPFAKSGRFGGGLHQQALAEGMTSSLADIYNKERQNQMAVLGMSPQLNEARYQDAQKLSEVGAQREDLMQQGIDSARERFDWQQNLPYWKLQQYAGILNPGIAIGGDRVGSSMTPMHPGNRKASALGGAAAGAAMGSMFAPGIGTAIGGLLGAYGGYKYA